ncbi:MAG: hypothetical protein MdMp014T_0384 [Treponematales bacterium]
MPAPLELGEGSMLTLKLDGTSTLKGGMGTAGIYVPEDAAVIITSAAGDGETAGVLNACGGAGAAGIGGNWGLSAGTIQIAGGTVYAMGDNNGYGAYGDGDGSSGIGGGTAGNGGIVTITGGSVYATGWNNGSGIGGGRGVSGGAVGNSGTISINSPAGTSRGAAEAKVSKEWFQPGRGIGCGSWGQSSGAFEDGSEGAGFYEKDADGWPTSAVYSW